MQPGFVKKSQGYTFFFNLFFFFWAKPREEQAVLQNAAASIYLNISVSCCHVPTPHSKPQQITSFILDAVKETRVHSTDQSLAGCKFLQLHLWWACGADFHQRVSFNWWALPAPC